MALTREQKFEMMDAAAEQAALELPACESAQDVLAWHKRWFMKAGYKRLGRVMKDAV